MEPRRPPGSSPYLQAARAAAASQDPRPSRSEKKAPALILQMLKALKEDSGLSCSFARYQLCDFGQVT